MNTQSSPSSAGPSQNERQNTIIRKGKASKLLNEIKPKKSPSPPSEKHIDYSMLYVWSPIPMEYWKKRWLLSIPDSKWRSITESQFPATMRTDHSTHFGYVMREIGNYSIELVPVSSRSWSGSYYIPKGTCLDTTGFVIKMNSYLVTKFTSSLPRNNRTFPQTPKFLGILPAGKLKQKA